MRDGPACGRRDGCRAWWLVVLVEEQGHPISSSQVRLCTKIEEILSLSPKLAVIAIDISIGLPDQPQRGGRVCDQKARRLLGPRASSVFSPPSRNLLEATRDEAVRVGGINLHAFGILKKVREVARLMTPELQTLVRESHPELAFMALSGHPMRLKKRRVRGRQERLCALERGPGHFFQGIRRAFVDGLKALTRKQVVPDDLIDAAVLAWTALHLADGTAERIPPDPPIDRRGLRMEIWY